MFHIYMYKYICMYMHECRSLAQFKRNKPKSKSPPQRSTALAEYLTLAPAAMEPRCLDARQKYVYPPEPYSRWKNIITTKNWIGRIRKLCDERNSAHMSRQACRVPPNHFHLWWVGSPCFSPLDIYVQLSEKFRKQMNGYMVELATCMVASSFRPSNWR